MAPSGLIGSKMSSDKEKVCLLHCTHFFVCKQKQTTSKDRVSLQETSAEGIYCSMCEFTTTSKQGLKIHNSKVHSKIDFASFPAACDVCEKVLTDEKELKEHKKREYISHTVRYQ